MHFRRNTRGGDRNFRVIKVLIPYLDENIINEHENGKYFVLITYRKNIESARLVKERIAESHSKISFATNGSALA